MRGVALGAGYFAPYPLRGMDADTRGRDRGHLQSEPRSRAAPIMARYGIPRYYGDWKAMIDRERPDFVDIITPPETHEEICALRRRARRAHHLSEAAGADATTPADASSSSRALPASASWCTRTSAGSRGTARSRQIQARRRHRRLHPSRTSRCEWATGGATDAYLARQPFFRDYPRLLIYETGVHFIDTFRFLLGEVVERVRAAATPEPGHQRRGCGAAVLDVRQRRHRDLGRQPLQRSRKPSSRDSRSANCASTPSAGT